MLSDESAGKAGPPSGPKRSHLAPTSLSWTWLYIHHLQIIWSPITSRGPLFLLWPGAVRWQLPLSLGGETNLKLGSAQSQNQGKPFVQEEKSCEMFFFFCCHSVAFSRELFSRICFDIFVKLEMSKLALCILYMLQQLPIQLHNASK